MVDIVLSNTAGGSWQQVVVKTVVLTQPNHRLHGIKPDVYNEGTHLVVRFVKPLI